VTVLGAFGAASDWTSPFLTLTPDSQGNYAGSAQLPAGTYAYLFQVLGDAASNKTSFKRYSVDTTNPAYVACPAQSPTHGGTGDPNPCSQVTVPQASAPSLKTITGKTIYHGNPIAGYLVEIDRHESGTHHYFANRTTTASDGTYTLTVAPGSYRIIIMHPTLLNTTDVARATQVETLAALRRDDSSTFLVQDALNAGTVEMSYDDYSQMLPTSTTPLALPVTFTYTLLATAMSAQVALYFVGTGSSLGDPTKLSPGHLTSWLFDGTLTGTTQVTADANYYWGTIQHFPATASGVTWDGQSMAIPIVFQ
jgi:hypothetical protein